MLTRDLQLPMLLKSAFAKQVNYGLAKVFSLLHTSTELVTPNSVWHPCLNSQYTGYQAL